MIINYLSRRFIYIIINTACNTFLRHVRSSLSIIESRPFSQGTEERNHDLARVYREYFEHSVHPGNLAAFIDSYVRRTDLGISRSTPTSESCPAGRRLSMATSLQMPIINVCGALSPHQEDTVTLNSRLDPTKSSWMKVSSSHIYYVNCMSYISYRTINATQLTR